MMEGYRVASYTWPYFPGTLKKKGLVQCICVQKRTMYMGQVTLYKVTENTAMFNWSPCVLEWKLSAQFPYLLGHGTGN